MSVTQEDILDNSVHVFAEANDPTDILDSRLIQAVFLPAPGASTGGTPADAKGALEISQAEALLGVDHFNWYQQLEFPTAWSASEYNLPSGYESFLTNQAFGSKYTQADLYQDPVSGQVDTFVDSNQNGQLDTSELGSLQPVSSQEVTPVPKKSAIVDPLIQTVPQTFPFLAYDDSCQPLNFMSWTPQGGAHPTASLTTMTKGRKSRVSANAGYLVFGDAPSAGSKSYGPKEFTAFGTSLVGIAGNSVETWSGENTNFTWSHKRHEQRLRGLFQGHRSQGLAAAGVGRCSRCDIR